MKATDLVGRVFGRLNVVACAGSTDGTPARPLWRCRCTCGNEPIVRAACLCLLSGRHGRAAAGAPIAPRASIAMARSSTADVAAGAR
jgi:hypothetical protein